MTVEVTEDQVRWFRARRAHLIGPGAPDAATAARDIVGVQAQYENPALLALALRTAGTPTADALRTALYDDHSLVRTWGQRDTLHILAPEDWPLVASAQRAWPQSGRRDAMPTQSDLDAALAAFEAATTPLVRSDLFGCLEPRFVAEVAQHPSFGKDPERFAAGRLIWQLALAGHICVAQKSGAEQAYAPRHLWHPNLPWPDVSSNAAAAELVRRYLSTYAPATPADVAHFFGARTGDAKSWLKTLAHETTPIGCGTRKGLLALKKDVETLTKEPNGAWPVVLLAGFDTALMTHKDKDWISPDEAERPKIWRKAAQLSATVVRRGQIVGTWKHDVKKKEVRISVEMHGKAQMAPTELEDAAKRVATHCGAMSFDIAIQ